jgi:DNA-binding NarL/FixJ family response regulator
MPGLIVADDFQPVRHRLRMFLEAKGWGPCQEAANGAEALTLARRSKPDAVILDYSMPVMNGVETAKAFHDEMPDVQVFMFTGHVNPAQRSLSGIPAVGVFSKDKIAPLVDALSDCMKSVGRTTR